jgi:hypothetical protein
VIAVFALVAVVSGYRTEVRSATSDNLTTMFANSQVKKANRDSREQVTHVLQAFKTAAHQFEELPAAGKPD